MAGFGVIAGIGISVPYLRSLFPRVAGVQSLDVNVGALRPGQLKKVNWLGRPVLIMKRTQEDVRTLSATGAELVDPDSNDSKQPVFAKNNRRSRRGEVFVFYANCTHLGCEVIAGEGGGFECPCHQSQFDAAGRVVKGSAANINLEIPNYRFAGTDTIRLIHERG